MIIPWVIGRILVFKTPSREEGFHAQDPAPAPAPATGCRKPPTAISLADGVKPLALFIYFELIDKGAERKSTQYCHGMRDVSRLNFVPWVSRLPLTRYCSVVLDQVFCCIAIVAVAFVYFVGLWIRQLFILYCRS